MLKVISYYLNKIHLIFRIISLNNSLQPFVYIFILLGGSQISPRSNSTFFSCVNCSSLFSVAINFHRFGCVHLNELCRALWYPSKWLLVRGISAFVLKHTFQLSMGNTGDVLPCLNPLPQMHPIQYMKIQSRTQVLAEDRRHLQALRIHQLHHWVEEKPALKNIWF